MSSLEGSGEPIRRFLERLRSAGGEGFLAGAWDEAREILLRIIRENGVRRIARTAFPVASYLELDRMALEEGLEIASVDGRRLADSGARRILEEAEMGITGSDYAVADTGSLVMINARDVDRLVSSLPRVHVAFLDSSRIVGSLRDLFRILGEHHMEFNQTVSLVTGPSRTGDIGLQLTLGAHGPHRAYAVVL